MLRAGQSHEEVREDSESVSFWGAASEADLLPATRDFPCYSSPPQFTSSGLAHIPSQPRAVETVPRLGPHRRCRWTRVSGCTLPCRQRCWCVPREPPRLLPVPSTPPSTPPSPCTAHLPHASDFFPWPLRLNDHFTILYDAFLLDQPIPFPPPPLPSPESCPARLIHLSCPLPPGRLGIADKDVVEISNLHRQVQPRPSELPPSSPSRALTPPPRRRVSPARSLNSNPLCAAVSHTASPIPLCMGSVLYLPLPLASLLP